MEFLEDLPRNCPPSNARIPKMEVYYRLTDDFPPTERDFLCYKTLYPGKCFPDECIAKAISLCGTIKQCKHLQKYPTLRNKIITKIVLNEKSGVILKTSRESHYSWWRRQSFDPIQFCESVNNA